MLSFRDMPKSRYLNVEKAQPERTRRSKYVEKNAALITEPDKSDRSHIDKLVVTGRGFEAVKAVASVKDRVDENTSICLLNDGMGVLEEVRRKIFNGTHPEPNFVLGHMSHKLVFNRNRGSVKQLKTGRTELTRVDPIPGSIKNLPASWSRTELIKSLKRANALGAMSSHYDRWLRFKLPSMVFTAAVEPVCVLLDLSYNGLLNNRSAQSMMLKLIDEMAMVVEHLPEAQGSEELVKFLRGEDLKKYCYHTMTGKAMAPSDLLKRVEKGLQTDINYQNGYFLRRANKLGIDMPQNKLMVQMVKARRAEAMEKKKAFIPVEETTIESIRDRPQFLT